MVTSASDIVVKPVQVYTRSSTKHDENNSVDLNYETESMPPASSSSSAQKERNNRHLSPESHTIPRSRSHECNNRIGQAVVGSASGVGGFFKHFFKGMYVDMPLATAEGLRSMPKLYGGEVREIGKVTDWKSGAIIAGKNFKDGMVDGFTDLVREPIRAARSKVLWVRSRESGRVQRIWLSRYHLVSHSHEKS